MTQLNKNGDLGGRNGDGTGMPTYEGLFLPLLFGMVALLCKDIALGIGADIATSARGMKLTAESPGNGSVLATGIIFGNLGLLVCVPMTKIIAPKRVEEYLHLRMPPARSLALWALAFVVFIASCDLLRFYLGMDLVPDENVASWNTCHPAVAYVVAIVLFAPIAEELFFRGFLFEAICRSRFGPTLAVLITSVMWASIHGQYGYFDRTSILVMGLLLGVIRLRTKSVFSAIWLHMLNNAVAMVQIAIMARAGAGQ